MADPSVTTEVADTQSKMLPSTARKVLRAPAPTHFLAVRIFHPTIVDRLQSVQNSMLSQLAADDATRFLCQTATPIHKSHLTLFVMSLPTPQHIQAASETLWSLERTFLDSLIGQEVSLHGVGSFSSNVVFAKPVIPDQLVNFVSVAEATFRDRLSEMDESAEPPAPDPSMDRRYWPHIAHVETGRFNPHVTLFKTSKLSFGRSNQNRRRPSAKLPVAKLTEPFADFVFGAQPIGGIKLCSMAGQGEIENVPSASVLPENQPQSIASADAPQEPFVAKRYYRVIAGIPLM